MDKIVFDQWVKEQRDIFFDLVNFSFGKKETIGCININIYDKVKKVFLNTQGDLVPSNAPMEDRWQEFFEWLIGDINEMVGDRCIDTTIEDISYAGTENACYEDDKNDECPVISPNFTSIYLANPDGNGATDVEFAETMVAWYLLQTNSKENNKLTKKIMRDFDTEACAKLMKDILDEILFSEEIDSSAWWKQ